MKQQSPGFDTEKVVKHWMATSDEDYRTMLSLLTTKSNHWALFLGHISVEKLLKAYYVKLHGEHAPFTHNLYRLAELGNLDLDEEYSDWLDQLTSFNLNARYDDYKREFYNQCSDEFTAAWVEKIKRLREWIGQML